MISLNPYIFIFVIAGLLLHEMATGKHFVHGLLENLDLDDIHSSEVKQVIQLLSSDSFRRIGTKEGRIQQVLLT